VPRRHRVFGGLTPRQEHIFTWMATVAVLLYATAWFAAIQRAIEQQREVVQLQHEAGIKAATPIPPPVVAPAQQVASAMLDPQTPSTAFINDAMLTFLSPLRGASGKVRLATISPGGEVITPPEGTNVSLKESGTEGFSKLAVQIDQATREIADLNVVTLVPFSEKHAGRIGPYYLGNWPFENGGRPPKSAYDNPKGFIEVTRDNVNTSVSEHFHLGDFLTKDQPNVWPKYLLLNPKVLDKLELTISELQKMGHPVHHITVMSGFRTPSYNVHGGNTAGRANLSRHMYGDASDVFIDNDRNGVMDDLNGDGRVDVRDAEVILQAAERVERNNPSLVGGVGVYSACCGHGPFTHIDVRGYRARWRGVGGG
jgi:hypothetical protein